MDLFYYPEEVRRISRNSEDFALWIRENLKAFLEIYNFNAINVRVAIQIGAEAGKEIEVLQTRRGSDSEERWKKLFNSKEQNDEATDCFVLHCEITKFLDRPIGSIRAAAPATIGPVGERSLQMLADRMALSIRAAKQITAAKYFTDPALYYVASLDELASWCRNAISCAGIVIWKAIHEASTSTREVSSPLKAPVAHRPTLLKAAGGSPAVAVDMRSDEGVAGFCFEERTPIRVDDLLSEEEIHQKTGRKIVHKELVEKYGWRSGVFLPLSDRHEILGVLGIYGIRSFGFNNLDLEISLQCAHHVAHRLKVDADVSQLKNYQERMKELAGEVDIARYLVVGRVHDALNNLKFAHDNLTFVKSAESTDQYLDAAKVYLSSTRRFIRTLRDKFTVEKKMSVEFVDTPIRSFLNEELRALKVDCLNRRIELKVSCDDSVMAAVDKFRLSSIIYNLVQNSIQNFEFMRGREKQIIVSATNNDGILTVSVFDNGPGIEPGFHKRVWEPFFSRRGGMGLGLAMVKRYVEDLGGDVKLESSWGQFTEVSFEVPCGEVASSR